MSVFFIISGSAFLLIPEQVMTPFGIEVSEQLKHNEQLYGITLISFAVLTWLSRDVLQVEALRAAVYSLLVYCALGVVVTLIHQLKGMANSLGWGVVIIHFLFAVALAYTYHSESTSGTQ
jgi:hypothetical protein